MIVHRHVERVGRRLVRPVLTLGSFDGVHRGHQAIMRRVVESARACGGTAVALTFHPHPLAVLAPERAPLQITDWRARLARIAATGIDAVVAQRFTRRFSEIDPVDFVERLLVAGLGVHGVIVGHRVSFGYRRAGNAETLERLGRRHGFAVEVIGPVRVGEAEVSSSAIRRAIAAGDIAHAAALLGCAPIVAGRVVAGDRRGRTLGFPTANLDPGGWVLPPDGVYAVEAVVDGVAHPAVANLGRKPTFGEHARRLEVHLIDWDGDLYGRRVEARFGQRLRGEMKFAGVAELVAQIGRDVAAARAVFAGAGGDACGG